MTTLPPCAWRTGPWPPLPPSVAARNVLAATIHRTGCTAEAIAQFRSVIAAQPGDPVPLCNLAGVLREANRPEDSLAEVQRLFALAARTDPSQAWVFQRAALLHQQPLILP
jgi:predicted Zn-dependent protease